MKSKRIIAVVLAVILVSLSVMSAAAAELTESSPSGKTEVTAQIGGAQPGDVSYIITIPDAVDFGTLTQPSDNTVDSYKDVTYSVEATKIEGIDTANQQVSVYVRDEHATVDGDDEFGQEFWITNKSDSTKKFFYDVYNVAGDDFTESSISINANTMTSASGYYLTGFTQTGESMNGTLRINQVQLCDYNLADIVGDYSGYMVFFSAVESV